MVFARARVDFLRIEPVAGPRIRTELPPQLVHLHALRHALPEPLHALALRLRSHGIPHRPGHRHVLIHRTNELS
jgi:hypothetical protein